MRPTELSLLISLSVLLMGGGCSNATKPPADSITFRFAPAVDKPFTQTNRTTTITHSSEGTRTRNSTMTATGIFSFTKEGYRLSGQTLSMKATHDGKDVTDAIAKLIEGVSIIYEMDRNGTLTSIEGYGDFLEKIFAMVPADRREALQKSVNEEALINKDSAEWDSRISSFVGQTVALGDVRTDKSDFPLPGGGSITFYSTTTFLSRERCGTAECVRIEFQYNTDRTAFGDAFTGLVPEAEITRADARIVGHGYRVVDPATMNIYSEVIERTMAFEITIDGKTHPATTTEKREMTVDYSDSDR